MDTELGNKSTIIQGTVKTVTSTRLVNNYFDGLPVTKKQILLFVTISIAFFFEQLDNQNFSFIAPAIIKTWGVTPMVIAQISSMFFLGMTLGGITGGLISDFLGRRKAFLLSLLLAPCASVMNGLTSSVGVFMLSRVVTGFGIFCMMTIAGAYMSEMTPKESRGKIYSTVCALGFLVQSKNLHSMNGKSEQNT
ncbi:MFS transporter [Desulfosporosinus fructosivorans]|uniref:MFS transporter n=1 Tax=Desulfosporosinus fructosivorans TaxID=2018669 RepID=UPI00130DE595|nr:MFS transporter [Desulfosporosinus fructosivorans]